MELVEPFAALGVVLGNLFLSNLFNKDLPFSDDALLARNRKCGESWWPSGTMPTLRISERPLHGAGSSVEAMVVILGVSAANVAYWLVVTIVVNEANPIHRHIPFRTHRRAHPGGAAHGPQSRRSDFGESAPPRPFMTWKPGSSASKAWKKGHIINRSVATCPDEGPGSAGRRQSKASCKNLWAETSMPSIRLSWDDDSPARSPQDDTYYADLTASHISKQSPFTSTWSSRTKIIKPPAPTPPGPFTPSLLILAPSPELLQPLSPGQYFHPADFVVLRRPY